MTEDYLESNIDLIHVCVLGCILGEMLLSKPLFQGTSTFNQLERILQHIPTPSQADIASISSQYGPSVLERATLG